MQSRNESLHSKPAKGVGKKKKTEEKNRKFNRKGILALFWGKVQTECLHKIGGRDNKQEIQITYVNLTTEI